jgi:hypothetical protein
MIRIPNHELLFHDDYRFFYRGEPFTGIRFKLYDNGVIQYEEVRFEGMETGAFREWYSTGHIKSDSPHYSDFQRRPQEQLYRQWHPNGAIALIGLYDDNFPLEVKRWDDEGHVVERMLKSGRGSLIPDTPTGKWLEIKPKLTMADGYFPPGTPR